MLLLFLLWVAEWPPVWKRAVRAVYCVCLSWAFVIICVCPSFLFGIESVGWLVVLGLNGPLRQYFSLYRAVSQRGRKKRELIDERN